MLNEPLALVSALISRLVANARTLTEAPCTTAPLASVTVPLIEPSVCWAMACAATRMMHISVIKPRFEERLFETETATAEREVTERLLGMDRNCTHGERRNSRKQSVKSFDAAVPA